MTCSVKLNKLALATWDRASLSHRRPLLMDDPHRSILGQIQVSIYGLLLLLWQDKLLVGSAKRYTCMHSAMQDE